MTLYVDLDDFRVYRGDPLSRETYQFAVDGRPVCVIGDKYCAA